MAKNWTLGEALTALKNYDKAAISDFGKRFPLATNALMEAKDGEKLINAIPERVTMRKIEAVLKDGVDVEEAEDIDTVEEDEADMAAPKKGRPTKKAAKSDEEKKAAAKARREARKARKAAAMNEPEDDEEDDEEDYSGMNALELFKLCKKRGITAQPKQKSSVYISLLKAADEKAGADEDEDGDDWEDDDEEEAKPEPTKKKAGRPKKAPAKKEEPDEDEDEDEDDWDI